jgi:hypothetical protein
VVGRAISANIRKQIDTSIFEINPAIPLLSTINETVQLNMGIIDIWNISTDQKKL